MEERRAHSKLMSRTNVDYVQPRERKTNMRVLTEVREKFELTGKITSAFKITNVTHRSRKNELFTGSSIKRMGNSIKSINRKHGDWGGTCEGAVKERIEKIKEEMIVSCTLGMLDAELSIVSKLSAIFELGEFINENFYNYAKVEKVIKSLNENTKQLQSQSLAFYGFVVSGLVLFEYGSFSLSIFYLDKALKILNTHQIYSFNPLLELLVYKAISKIFMQIGLFSEARDMAYMFLRKAWKFKNVDEEMNAYDLLGQIELEKGSIEMSRYFHLRMCQGVQENHDIVVMSNNELEKNQKEKIEFTVYEDIMVFVKQQRPIISILSNHYRSEAEDQCKDIGGRNKHLFMYTHRSPNRVLRNHRSIERKLIDEKQSIQLHFIRPKDIKRLRKIVTEFSSFIFELRRKCEVDFLRDSSDCRLGFTAGF